jgi:leucyl aminopeptidase
MSWMRAGYPAAFVAESRWEHFAPNVHGLDEYVIQPPQPPGQTKLTLKHSRIDISPEFSFEHMLHFAKLAAAFAIELGGWEK